MSEFELDEEPPECFGDFGITDDCFGCPWADACEEDWEERYGEDIFEDEM